MPVSAARRCSSGDPASFVVAIRQQGFVDIAAQTSRERDQTLGVPRQQVFIDAGLVIKPFEVTGRDQLDQVAVAFLVLTQQHQVVVAIGVALNVVTLLRDVYFAADYGMNAVLARLIIELDRSEQVAVVGHGDRRHLLLLRDFHQLRNFAGAVEQRVIGMAMKMNERRGHCDVQSRGRSSIIARVYAATVLF
jgi:hypothetical protein